MAQSSRRGSHSPQADAAAGGGCGEEAAVPSWGRGGREACWVPRRTPIRLSQVVARTDRRDLGRGPRQLGCLLSPCSFVWGSWSIDLGDPAQSFTREPLVGETSLSPLSCELWAAQAVWVACPESHGQCEPGSDSCRAQHARTQSHVSVRTCTHAHVWCAGIDHCSPRPVVPGACSALLWWVLSGG